MSFASVILLAGALLAIGSGSCSAAAPPAALGALVDQAHARQLAQHPYWMALVHYRSSGAGVASEVVSSDFFLAPDGATNADAELTATLAAFFEPAAELDGHAQCRFVARYRWLRKSLDWGAVAPPLVRCPQYAAYAMDGRVRSLSLVYATGFLSNPASFFGHILLKFNGPEGNVAYDLLDRSVNFGAAVPVNENPVRYILKGLFGGYDSAFSHHLFYNFNHAYAENELRDMWEYVLRLSDDEVQQIIAHSWELLGKNFAYYFLKENCGYRMAELLELVIHKPLLPDLPWSIPGAVFDRIASVQHNGAPLIAEVRRIPSRQNRFRARYIALSPGEKAAAREIVESRVSLPPTVYTKLPPAEQIAVVDTLLDYYEYRIILDRKDTESLQSKQKLLIERTRLPPRELSEDQPPMLAAAPPHEGPLPFLVRLGVVRNSVTGAGASFRLRPGNYDQLSLDAGRIPHSDLEILDLKATLFRHELRLRSFHVISIENLNAARTPLPSDGGISWDFQAGAETHDLECSSCTVLKTRAGIGKAMAAGNRTAFFGLVDLAAQSQYAGSGTVAVQPRLGFVASATTGWKTYLSVGRQAFLNGSRTGERVVRWENRLGASRKWDIRLTYQEHAAREIEAGLSLYW